MKETELAKPIIAYLEERGWNVYQEVLIRGKIADIVATFGKLTWVIECKTSLSLKLLEQAYNWRGRANYISIAVPSKSNSNDFVKGILRNEGIGILSISRFPEVFETIPPQLNRKVVDIKKYLFPEHKIFAKAGSKGGGYYTPFQKTKQNIEYNIKQYPNGILFSEFIKSLEHHYHSFSTAKSCLRQWIESGIICAKIVKQDNKLYIFPK